MESKNLVDKNNIGTGNIVLQVRVEQGRKELQNHVFHISLARLVNPESTKWVTHFQTSDMGTKTGDSI